MKPLRVSIACFAIAGIIIFLALQGCAQAPFIRLGDCRHQAVECALIFGEKTGGQQIGIASGPAIKNPQDWHSQAFLRNPSPPYDGPWKWLVNRGYRCEIDEKEPFTPVRLDTVGSFLDWQFKDMR